MIAILTWITYENYGTYLQAYALQHLIKKLGYNNKIIDDRRFTYLHYLPQTYMQWLKLLISQRRAAFHLWLKHRPFSNFAKRFLKIDYSWRDEWELNSRYDTYVCGSDQIWSPLLPDHHDGFYFGSFASKDKRLIAYAPSLGSQSASQSYVDMTTSWLQKFKCLSTREESGSKIIRQVVGHDNVITVLDPTLLLTKSDWECICRPKVIKNGYLLAYFLTYNEKYIQGAKSIADKLGCKFYIVNTEQIPSGVSCDKLVRHIGPEEFVTYIRDAEYVVTDSFHGSIFSIIFHKRFITLKRFSENDKNNQNSRIENLFEKLGLSEKFRNTLNENILLDVLDWNDVELRLDTLRNDSHSYLETALK